MCKQIGGFIVRRCCWENFSWIYYIILLPYYTQDTIKYTVSECYFYTHVLNAKWVKFIIFLKRSPFYAFDNNKTFINPLRTCNMI